MRTHETLTAYRLPLNLSISGPIPLLVDTESQLNTADFSVSEVCLTRWGVRQVLSPQLRTNTILYSEDFSNSVWQTSYSGAASAPIITPNYGPAPDGSNTACRVQLSIVGATGSNDWAAFQQDGGAPAGLAKETGALWFKSNTGSAQQVYLYTLDAAELVTIPPTWTRGYALNTNMSSTDPGPTDTTADILIWHPSVENRLAPGLYITTNAQPASATDYISSPSAITLNMSLFSGDSADWSGSYSADVLDASATLLSQYANSPRLTALVDYANEWIDPGVDLNAFYSYVWNVKTAQGFGLDIWGRIVNVPRQITITPLPDYLGYNEALTGSYPFGQEPFYGGARTGDVYSLSDDAYRVLIMTKALANISSFTAPSVNALLRFLFAGRGDCHVEELGGMAIKYVFNFALQPWEASVIQQPSLMPRPAGVNITIVVNP
jgi:hypothetical protein